MSLAPLRLLAALTLCTLVAARADAQVCTPAQPSVTFTTSGTLALPAGGAYTVEVSARGADGARPTGYTAYGGRGATIEASFVVSGGTTLRALVGTAGAAGTNAAGGGGGSAVSAGSTLLVVAGGGGGGGQQGGASGQGGRATLGGTPAGGAAGSGVAGVVSGGGGGGGFGVAGGGSAGAGGGAGSATARGAGGSGTGNGGAGVGGGGAGLSGGGGGGGYIGGAGGDASLTSYTGGRGGTSFVETAAFSGTVVSATAGATGDVADENGGTFSKKEGTVTLTCAAVPTGTVLTIPGTDGLGNDTGWRLLAPTAATALLADLGDDIDLALDAPGGLTRVIRWTGRTWVPVESADEIGGGEAVAVYLPDSADEPLTSAGLTLDFDATAPTEAVTVDGLDDQTAWAVFGNPFADDADLGTLVADGFRDAVFVWDPVASAYVPRSRAAGDLLAPGEAGFLRRDRIARGATALTLPAPAPARRVAADIGRARLEVVALDADGTPIGRAFASVVLSSDGSVGVDGFDAPSPGPLASAFAVAALGDDLGQEGLPANGAETTLRVGGANLGAARYSVRLLGVDGARPVGSVVAAFGGQTADLTAGVTLSIDAADVTEGTTASGARDGAATVALTVAANAVSSAPDAPDAGLALAVAPNPAAAVAQLTWTARGPVRIALYDALGREVAALDAPAGGQARLDVSGLPAGLYVARLTSDDGVAVRRLTVVR